MRHFHLKDIDNTATIYPLVGYAKNFACGESSLLARKELHYGGNARFARRVLADELRRVSLEHYPFIPPPTSY
jgi:hypothetical protein